MILGRFYGQIILVPWILIRSYKWPNHARLALPDYYSYCCYFLLGRFHNSNGYWDERRLFCHFIFWLSFLGCMDPVRNVTDNLQLSQHTNPKWNLGTRLNFRFIDICTTQTKRFYFLAELYQVKILWITQKRSCKDRFIVWAKI